MIIFDLGEGVCEGMCEYACEYMYKEGEERSKFLKCGGGNLYTETSMYTE